MTTHDKHPSDAVLADYASGAMRPAFAAVTAAHLEHCAHCRSRVSDLETAGLALIEDLEPTPVSRSTLEVAMAALDELPPLEPEAPRPILERLSFGKETWIAPGTSIRKARVEQGQDLLYLLRLPAGVTTLPHGHQGMEFTAVLRGAYVDGGVTYAAGDFCEMDPSVDHQPQVTADAECICLIASERPMRMGSTMGRLVQAFLRV